MGGLWTGAGARTLRTLVLVGLLGPVVAHRTAPRGGALPSNGLEVLTVLRDSRNPRQPLTRRCYFCALRGGGTEARDELGGEPRAVPKKKGRERDLCCCLECVIPRMPVVCDDPFGMQCCRRPSPCLQGPADSSRGQKGRRPRPATENGTTAWAPPSRRSGTASGRTALRLAMPQVVAMGPWRRTATTEAKPRR